MNSKVKWYNNPEMVGALLLFWTPIGVYGLYKSETINSKWKKVAYGTLTLACILLTMLYRS